MTDLHFFDMKYLHFKTVPGITPAEFKHYSSNVSMAGPIDDYGTLLYAVRFESQMLAGKVIPGNSLLCKEPYEIGKNFWWNNWWTDYIIGFTCFFVSNVNDLLSNEVVEISVDKNSKRTNNIDLRRLVGRLNLQIQDVRLATIDKNIYLYSADLKLICSVVLDKQHSKIILKQLPIDIPKNELYGKNQAVIDIEVLENNTTRLVYIDWFYKDSVVIMAYDFKENKNNYPSVIKSETFNIYYVYNIFGPGSYDDNKDKQYFGVNYGVSPGLSLSTPCILVDDFYLGVGHVKIHSNINQYPYIEGSNISEFRKNLYSNYKSRFGSKYIRHQGTNYAPNCVGYIYMLYFYTLKFSPNNNTTVIHISDAYLPLNMDEEREYKFSLVMPLGLVRSKEKVLVSCGEGDFYSMICTFRLNDVVNLCKHNVEFIDFNQYNYYVLENHKDNFIINKLY
jgi:hypothetical protein